MRCSYPPLGIAVGTQPASAVGPPRLNPFTVYDFADTGEQLVVVKTFGTELYHDDHRDVAVYVQVFDALSAAARSVRLQLSLWVPTIDRMDIFQTTWWSPRPRRSTVPTETAIYYFLESNRAGGQYGWLEAKTGVRLTEAVADLLAGLEWLAQRSLKIGR